jgi:hypothetical protein
MQYTNSAVTAKNKKKWEKTHSLKNQGHSEDSIGS